MIRPRLKFRRDTKVSAEEATAKFGNEFFPRPLRPVLGIARQVTSHAMFCRRPVGRLMAEDCRVPGGIAEGFERRHLDIVHGRRIVCLVAAVPNDCAGIAEELVGVTDALDRAQERFGCAMIVVRQAVDLRHVEHRVRFKERNIALHLAAVAVGLRLGELA